MLRAAGWQQFMARSKHTAPRSILAAKRVRAPYAARSVGDPRHRQRIALILKEAGLPGPLVSETSSEDAPLPRILVRHPRPGWIHPVSKVDIQGVLRCFGESCFYGLRSIELRQTASANAPESLLFGQLVVPGRIILYEQRPSPWILHGVLSGPEINWLRPAGAEVRAIGQGVQTEVIWPGDTLRDFILFDVLMHEVGHHLIQHYKGKRTVRTARTRDHEAFAVRFAQRCRQLYQQPREPG
jgi:hypothetical protein